jgi:hypothetical protein
LSAYCRQPGDRLAAQHIDLVADVKDTMDLVGSVLLHGVLAVSLQRLQRLASEPDLIGDPVVMRTRLVQLHRALLSLCNSSLNALVQSEPRCNIDGYATLTQLALPALQLTDARRVRFQLALASVQQRNSSSQGLPRPIEIRAALAQQRLQRIAERLGSRFRAHAWRSRASSERSWVMACPRGVATVGDWVRKASICGIQRTA